jgi:peptide/nickel transport system ATP-binding protein
MSDPLLDVRDLHVTYRSSRGPIPAVRGVSFQLARGETLGLAGESGSGKSTMTMALLRLVPVGTSVTGSVTLAGEDVLAMKPGRLRAVRWAEAAVVFQGAQHVLNPVRRIAWQIQEAIDVHSGTNKVADLLEQVGIPRWRTDAYPHELSGGQKQRVMIAMALACDPELLIADEPTTALDVMVQAQVLQLLADLQRDRGLAMIFITHDLSVLSTVADRLAVMYAGRLVETGPAKEMLRGAQHPYTRALAAAFPTIGDPSSRLAPSGLAGDPPDPAAVPSGCTFHPRCPIATAECATTTVDLHQISTGWEASCLKL